MEETEIQMEERRRTPGFNQPEEVDPASEGVGVGLTLAKRIVEAHRGEIWIESRGAETGTTICFTLPPATATTGH